MHKALVLAGLMLALPTVSHAQTAEEIRQAREFFATHDASGDGQLSKDEFVDGFVSQAREDRPVQAALVISLYSLRRIENCLGLGFDRADIGGNGLLSVEELGEAYRQEAFADLREIC